MKRTLVGFSDQDIRALDALSDIKRVSRAELIRQAVSQYLEMFSTAEVPEDAFGAWKARKIDALAYQERLREEW
ncbi:CopG family transcriptional regulator [Rhodoferax sp.]|uniref:ribbon-helix-helix domain-containing protein n=1 Tax=Rhodoferax sp. TaxID=50421 RepID=UPI00262D070F|nr:CopG family transcriptional regulator [Rhodoferax sp.]MDD2811202.1 ribbon-helix-helix domain-containing protein [Rhodoferax sp.]